MYSREAGAGVSRAGAPTRSADRPASSTPSGHRRKERGQDGAEEIKSWACVSAHGRGAGKREREGETPAPHWPACTVGVALVSNAVGEMQSKQHLWHGRRVCTETLMQCGGG